MHDSDTDFNWSCPIDEKRPGSCQLLYFSIISICWFPLYFFLFSKLGKYKISKNLDMNAFFFFLQVSEVFLIYYYLTLYQQVDSRKAATKQVNQMQNRLLEKKGPSERSAESCATWRKVQEEEKLTGLFNSETAQVRGILLLLFPLMLH